MMRVLSTRKRLLKLGPIFLVGGLAVSAVALFVDIGFVGFMILAVCVVVVLAGAAYLIAGPFMPHWLFEFDESGVRYYKAPRTQIAWADIQNFFYKHGAKGTIEFFLDIPNLPLKKNPLRFYFEFDLTEPKFRTFDDFRLELEKLYGAPVLDLTKEFRPSTFEWKLFLAMFLVPLLGIILAAILDVDEIYFVAFVITVVAIFVLTLRRNDQKLRNVLRSRRANPRVSSK